MPIITQKASRNLICAGHKIAKMYCQNEVIYSAGNTVTYIVDGISYQEDVEEGASCLSPKTFTPSKSGWEFVGWRQQDTAANDSVLSNLIMENEPITLYAVFRQAVTTACSIKRPYKDRHDWTGSMTITTQYVSSATISGTLISDSQGDSDWRCDATLYVNNVQIDTLYSNGGEWSKPVSQSLRASNGLVVKLLVHPHSDNQGSGSFVGTVTYQNISVG